MTTFRRNLGPFIESVALDRGKMAFISGPRQCGKTTLAKGLLGSSGLYRSWDQVAFKKTWVKDSDQVAREALAHRDPIMVLDEFHKNVKWKNQLKGFYDTYGDKIRIVVTGSAHLNTFRKGSDSLLGRFVHFHLHPFSLGELSTEDTLTFTEFAAFISSPGRSDGAHSSIASALFKFGGFPEPFLARSEAVHRIWSKNRNELLVRQDLRETSHILNVGQVEVLASFLPDRVAAPLSVQAIAEDLDVAHTTVTRWLDSLRSVYFHFELKPYSKSIPRSLKKEGKIYLYDWSAVEDEGRRFENMTACHLLKLVDFYNDTGQADLGLHYLRDKEKREIDFLVTNRQKPLFTVEAKLRDFNLARGFEPFQARLKVPHFQIVEGSGILREFAGARPAYVIGFQDFFADLP